MDILEKIKINKEIKDYVGLNTFILSLKKQLVTTKLRESVDDKRPIKVLSEKQYDAAKRILDS
jgi:hypothetical protein